MHHVTLTEACLAFIAATGLILVGYVAGWRRARTAYQPEELPGNAFWGPEVGDAYWQPGELAAELEASTVVMPQVPTITEVPDATSQGRPAPRSRAVSNGWLAQPSLGDLVSEPVRGRVVSSVPEGALTSPVMVTAPQPALSDETAEFLVAMRRRTDMLIASFEARSAV